MFCSSLYSEIGHLEERDFLTFRNETVKLLSGLQSKAEERKRQVTTTQRDQVITLQLPQVTQVTTGHEYILTIPDTEQVSTPTVQPNQIAAPQSSTVIANVQPPRSALVSSYLASFLVLDDQQPGPSRQLMFALSPTKIFNPPSVTSGQQKTVNTTLLDDQVFSEVFHLYCSTSRSTHHNHFHPLNFNQHRHQ